MTQLTLDAANRIIAAIIARGVELQCRPLAVIVVDEIRPRASGGIPA